MKAVLFRLPTLLAIPFIAVAVLVGGLIGLVLVAVAIAAGCVAFASFVLTAVNLGGFAATHDPNALTAALKTGLWFVLAFSVSGVFGAAGSAFLRRGRPHKSARLAAAGPMGIAKAMPELPQTLRLELARDARF